MRWEKAGHEKRKWDSVVRRWCTQQRAIPRYWPQLAREFLQLCRRKAASGRGGGGSPLEWEENFWLVDSLINVQKGFMLDNSDTLFIRSVHLVSCINSWNLTEVTGTLFCVVMKDWFSFIGVVTGKYSAVNNGATSTAHQTSWRSAQSSFRIQRRPSVFVNQFFKETGFERRRRIRPRCKFSSHRNVSFPVGRVPDHPRGSEINLTVLLSFCVNSHCFSFTSAAWTLCRII
jgi:hypothetical protein